VPAEKFSQHRLLLLTNRDSDIGGVRQQLSHLQAQGISYASKCRVCKIHADADNAIGKAVITGEHSASIISIAAVHDEMSEWSKGSSRVTKVSRVQWTSGKTNDEGLRRGCQLAVEGKTTVRRAAGMFYRRLLASPSSVASEPPNFAFRAKYRSEGGCPAAAEYHAKPTFHQ